MQACKARKSVSRLSAQPTEILGTKRKLPRQRALSLELGRILSRINLARAGRGNCQRPRRFSIPSYHSNSPAQAQAVREARPTEGNGPDAGGSAFLGRTKSDGNNRKTNPYLSKTAQFPQVVGVGGFCRYFAALRLTISNLPNSHDVASINAIDTVLPAK